MRPRQTQAPPKNESSTRKSKSQSSHSQQQQGSTRSSRSQDRSNQGHGTPGIIWKPNATYLYCPTIQQVTPPDTGPWETSQDVDMVMVFLIPPSSLGTGDQEGTLEVTCEVRKVQSVMHNFSSLSGGLS